MEKLHKDILIHLRKNIIDDLDVDNDVIQPLRNEYIITEDHIKNIYIGATKEERAAKLLDILPLYAYLYIFRVIFAHTLCKNLHFFILMLLHLLIIAAVASHKLFV